jgi:hypothetical protein
MSGRRSFLLYLYLCLPLVAGALLSCADLPIIEANRCGNGFIEPGEDCDYFNAAEQKGGPPVDTATCNLPGTSDECHWRCNSHAECQKPPVDTSAETETKSADTDQDATGLVEGSGWRCGGDHVCRLPRGADGGRGTFFEPVGTLVSGSVDALFSGDFDGDGHQDVLAMGEAGFAIHYFSRDGSEAKSLGITGAPVTPAIGKLTSSAADDFTLDVARGLGVMLGGLGETVAPTSYLSLDIAKRYGGGDPPDGMRLLLLDSGPGPRPIALANIGDFVQVIDASSNPKGDQSKVVIDLSEGYGRKTLLGSIPVSFLESPKAQGDRQRFLLAYQGESSLLVVDIDPTPPPMTAPVLKTPLALPPGFTVHGAAFFGDVDADGLTDALVGAARCAVDSDKVSKCSEAELVVAYGDGEGAFYGHPKSGSTWDEMVKGQASLHVKTYPYDKFPLTEPLPEAEIEQFLPLAIGQLNNDAEVDYVNAFGIYVSNSSKAIPCAPAPDAYCRTEEPSVGGIWSEARIEDFNIDGRADVVGVSPGIRGIDYFNGTGTGIFNTFSLPTEGDPRSLAVGDFDGDLISDLAFDSVTAETDKNNPTKAPYAHELFVAFGSPAGAPAAPADMGRVPNLLRLVAGSIPSLGPDAASDIMILSGVEAEFTTNQGVETRSARGGDWKVGLAQGNGYRQLQAPLLFFSPGTIAIHGLPLASAIGVFQGAMPTPQAKEPSSHADLAAVILTRASTDNFDAPPAGPPLCDFAAELWLLPATGDAVIEPPDDSLMTTRISATPGGAVEPLLPIRRLVEAAPIHLDGDTEGLVIAFPSYSNKLCAKDLAKMDGFGELYLARFDAKGKPVVTQIVSFVGPKQFLVHLRVGDVDGDGKPDIVALRSTLDLDTLQPVTSDVVLLRNQGDGTFAAPAVIEVGGNPIDVVLVNAEGKSDLEIVVVTEPEQMLQEPALFVIDWDEAAGKTTKAAQVVSSNPEQTSTSPLLEGPKALAGGDFDGDGLDDVVVAVAGGIRLFKGVAR